MANKNNPKGRENELVVQKLKDEVLIYDLNNNKAYCLNPTSAIIWNLCDGSNSVADITKQASKKLVQPVTDELVWLAIDQFKEDKLLSNNQEMEIKFDGLSRREVIRKVGLASLIALPVISSLMAPSAASAASATSCGKSCTRSGECVQGCTTCLGVCPGTANSCRPGGFCNATGVCGGSGTCSFGGSPCGNIGGTCGPNGMGTCEFIRGICTEGGTPCSTLGGACTGPGTCSSPGTCQ